MNNGNKYNLETLNQLKIINPNLEELRIENNILYSNDDEIVLDDFLISELSYNASFLKNKSTISIIEFMNIVKTNVLSKEYLKKYLLEKTNKNIDENEFITRLVENNHEINIITNTSKRYVFKNNIEQIKNAYEKLCQENNYYVSLASLLRTVNLIESNTNNLEYFNLLKKVFLNEFEKIKITKFEEMIKYLVNYQDYLCEDANLLYNLFKMQLYSLEISEERTNLENHAVDYYHSVISEYTNKKLLELDITLKKEEKKSSLGYSSLVLIVTSTLITSLFITYLTFIISK